MAIVGYARVSTREQATDAQEASCIIPISVLSFWRDAYGVAWHTGGVVRRIAALA